MYKIVLYVLLALFFMVMYALQMDEEMAIHTLFRTKHALNRSAHAAAQQLDYIKLARGIYSLDPIAAEAMALLYLQQNLNLTVSNDPIPGSFLRSRVEVLVFEVINENHTFPYTYFNDTYKYTVTLERPGVIMVIQVDYPRTYNVIGPISWKIKGAAELVYDR